ncbi:hypothetical protein B0T40_04390 [Chromobacterium haemolyticum]|uniref:hypothetical protein n=1 Tax=Chromobacterium haemolyticum TaxID=394935 RepID=UPI0009DAC239|nr:hypothetical protein [Chromobacterium haemolyticum]OQS39032.1 hypothetical protein B0T40_04390 [Chromobacterium haemolyticum]
MSAVLPLGRPVPNVYMLAGAHRIAAAIELLSREGLTVLSSVQEHPMKPTIRVRHSIQCDRLIATGEAKFYSFGHDNDGRFSEAQFERAGCRVVWTQYP